MLNILCSIHQFIIHTFLLSLSSVLSNKHDRTFHHCFAGWLSRRGTAWLGSPVLTSVSNGPIFLTNVNVFLRKIGHNLDLFGLHLGLFFLPPPTYPASLVESHGWRLSLSGLAVVVSLLRPHLVAPARSFPHPSLSDLPLLAVSENPMGI